MSGKDEVQAKITTDDFEFTFEVDYDREIEALIKGDRYVPQNFAKGVQFSSLTRHGAHRITAQLVTFSSIVTSCSILQQMDESGLRPGEAHELLEFSRERWTPDKRFLIVSLGSTWLSCTGLQLVPCLRVHDSLRDLSLYGFNMLWDTRYHFMAVRK